MIEVKKEGILLQKTALGLENEGILNPAVIQEGDRIHLFYRAVSRKQYLLSNKISLQHEY